MATTRVNFTEWLPDQPGVVGALTNALNVYPKAVGYGPFPEEEDYSDSASENLNSVFASSDSSGNTKVFAGGATKLFLLDALDMSLNDVSSTTYSAGSDWKFIQFGSFLIAGNDANKLQYVDLSTTTVFSDLSASAPTAKLLTAVRDFVVVGNTSTANNEVRWSGINNPTGTWGSIALTQADFQTIPDGGQIRGLTGGEFGLILLERSIVRMSYVGAPLVFQFDNISKNLGCYESNSVVQWQGITYFLADDGFYACNGQQVDPIGAEKVNRYFWNTLIESRVNEMSTSVDPFRNLVIWGYPSTDLTYRILMYHTVTKKWSFAETSVNRLSNLFTPSFTLEQLDNFSASLDAMLVSLDDRQWVGGKFLFGGVSADKIITFSGPNKTARITTADLETDSNMSMITLAKPIIENGSASVAVASRMNLEETPSFNDAVAASSENRVGLRSLGRYHRVRVIPSGNWTTAIGTEIEINPAGMR
jgi:hypothetical protein